MSENEIEIVKSFRYPAVGQKTGSFTIQKKYKHYINTNGFSDY